MFFVFFFDIVLVIALDGGGAICIQLTTLRCYIVVPVANNTATTGCSEGGLVCVCAVCTLYDGSCFGERVKIITSSVTHQLVALVSLILLGGSCWT